MRKRALLVLTLLLASAGFLPAQDPGRATTRPVLDAARQVQPTSRPVAQLAVYRWGAPKGVEQADAFAQWIGCPGLWAEDFEASDSWNNIESPGWQLWPWQNWINARAGRKLILSVPMLPGGWDRSGPGQGIDAKQPVSLEAGARGDYNKHFAELARQLVERKMAQGTVLRIGWEFNGGWYTWRGSDNPKAWTEYYRQIVKTMRAVPGAQDLIFVWNPATDYLQFPAEQAYPGDEYVDVIGVDVYDQSWLAGAYPIPKDATDADKKARQVKVWNEWTYGGNHGLKFWNEFAQEHKKPLAICEWGVCDREDGHGGGDNPYFIEQMHQFIMDPKNNVTFHCYFDVEAGDGAHQLSPGAGVKQTRFPKSAAMFQKLFGHSALP